MELRNKQKKKHAPSKSIVDLWLDKPEFLLEKASRFLDKTTDSNSKTTPFPWIEIEFEEKQGNIKDLDPSQDKMYGLDVNVICFKHGSICFQDGNKWLKSPTATSPFDFEYQCQLQGDSEFILARVVKQFRYNDGDFFLIDQVFDRDQKKWIYISEVAKSDAFNNLELDKPNFKYIAVYVEHVDFGLYFTFVGDQLKPQKKDLNVVVKTTNEEGELVDKGDKKTHALLRGELQFISLKY